MKKQGRLTYWCKVNHIQFSEILLILTLLPFEILYTSAKILILLNNPQNCNGSSHSFSLWDETEAIFLSSFIWKGGECLKSG